MKKILLIFFTIFFILIINDAVAKIKDVELKCHNKNIIIDLNENEKSVVHIFKKKIIIPKDPDIATPERGLNTEVYTYQQCVDDPVPMGVTIKQSKASVTETRDLKKIDLKYRTEICTNYANRRTGDIESLFSDISMSINRDNLYYTGSSTEVYGWSRSNHHYLEGNCTVLSKSKSINQHINEFKQELLEEIDLYLERDQDKLNNQRLKNKI